MPGWEGWIYFQSEHEIWELAWEQEPDFWENRSQYQIRILTLGVFLSNFNIA